MKKKGEAIRFHLDGREGADLPGSKAISANLVNAKKSFIFFGWSGRPRTAAMLYNSFTCLMAIGTRPLRSEFATGRGKLGRTESILYW